MQLLSANWAQVIHEEMRMIRIPKSIYRDMIAHARQAWPLECCGILAGKDSLVQKAFALQNAERSPVRFSIAPQDQLIALEEMEKESMEMLAIYHSHPQTIPFPSETDVEMTAYPVLTSVIISLKEIDNPVMKAFQIDKEAIYLQEIELVEEKRVATE